HESIHLFDGYCHVFIVVYSRSIIFLKYSILINKERLYYLAAFLFLYVFCTSDFLNLLFNTRYSSISNNNCNKLYLVSNSSNFSSKSSCLNFFRNALNSSKNTSAVFPG